MARSKSTVTYVSPLSSAVALELLSNDLPIPTNLWTPVTVPPIRAGGSDGKSPTQPPSSDPKKLNPQAPSFYPSNEPQNSRPRASSLPPYMTPGLRQVRFQTFRAPQPEVKGNWHTWNESEDSEWDGNLHGDADDEPVAGGEELDPDAPAPADFELDPRLLDPAPSTAEKKDDASAQDTPYIRIPASASDAAKAHGSEQLVYGLSRSFDDSSTPLDDFFSFKFSKPPTPLPWDPKTLENMADADSDEEEPDVLRHLSLDAILTDDVRDEEDIDEAWFAKFPTYKAPLAPLGPLYAQRPDLGTMLEEKAVESEVKSDDEDKNEEKQEREKAEKDKKKDVSPIFRCIIIADGAPLVPYPLDTVNALGNIPMSRYSTAIRIYDRLFECPELVITINICYGTHNVELASISLPLDTVTVKPKASTLDAKQLSTLLSYRGLTAEPQKGAFMQEVIFDNEETDVRFNRRALSDLQSLNMPRLGALQYKINRLFTSPCPNLTMLVTEEWKDFATWSEEFHRLFNEALSDPKATLKTRAKGQPITVRNYVPQLPEDACRLPARMKFRDVDDCITSLGDGTAREHAYEKWASTEIGNIQCYALMMPIGTQKCVLKRGDEDVQVPYLYSFSVVKTSDDKLFAELAPAINTSTKIQVQIGYRKVKPPTHDKSPEEVVGMIAEAMHNQLWDYRHKAKVSKEKLDQAWVDAYTDIIKPYVDAKELGDDNIHPFAYMLSQRLQKIRANKDQNIKSETPKEHRQRTTEQVIRYRKHLQLPPDITADIPQFSAVRMVHDEPLDKVSDFQFVAFRPKQMKWPKRNLGLAPAPFLDFKEPRLLKHGTLDQLAAKYLVPIRFVEVDDDMTAKSKIQGLLKTKEFQHTPLVEWFTRFNGNPITTDVTQELNDGLVAEYLHGNRVSLLCSSTLTQRGRSPVNLVHARLSVKIAARIHQSHIPGSDELTRPRICIITPYSAQVDETKNQLRKLSSKEICHDLVEVRTQTSSTGGEWDEVILCFVRDSSMGFLSETNRLNVMWTRAKYLSIDIFDEDFYRRPHGRGSKVIDRYRETQALNGGQCNDLRNWNQVCRRCFTPHEKDCRETLKCFFCKNTGHHVRNCTAPGSLDPTINPDVMDFPRIS